MSERKWWAPALLMTALAILLLCLRIPQREETAYTHREQPEPLPISMPDGLIDPNTADAEELTALYGVGETLAAAILTEREQNGPFRYPEDLLTVRGIGEKTLQRFWADLDFSGVTP